MRILGSINTIIHVINGRFMVVLTLLMLATMFYSCFNIGNAGKTPTLF